MDQEILQQIIEEWESGTSLEMLQARFPSDAEAIARTIQHLQAIKAVPTPPLSARAAQNHAAFLQAAAQKRQAAQKPHIQQPKPKPRSQPFWTRRWVWAIATMLVIFVLTGGTVLTASANALPGDSLYGIKRWRESVSLAWTPADQQVAKRIEFLAQRETELERLIDLGRPIPSSLVSEIQQETANLEQALPNDPRDPRWQRLVTVTDELETTLRTAPVVDPAVKDVIDDTLDQVEQTNQRSEDVVKSAPTATTKPATATLIPAQATNTGLPRSTDTAAIPTWTNQPAATNVLPSSTRVIQPTVTLTNVPTTVDPTATTRPTQGLPVPANTAVPTNLPPTRMPPTATNTAVPPTTPVPTNLPPTNTAVPPTNTVVPPTASDTPTGGEFPSATVLPTNVPSDQPTDQPSDQPTNTAQPTATTEPTTPKNDPTRTPRPTNDVPATAKPPTNTPKPTKTPKP